MCFLMQVWPGAAAITCSLEKTPVFSEPKLYSTTTATLCYIKTALLSQPPFTQRFLQLAPVFLYVYIILAILYPNVTVQVRLSVRTVVIRFSGSDVRQAGSYFYNIFTLNQKF